MSDVPTISLAEARKRARGKRNDRSGYEPADCPLTALGHIDGRFWFLTSIGERRGLSAGQLSKRAEIVGLFLGRTAWLVSSFPSKDGDDFSVWAAGDYLMRQCAARGLYGAHVAVRRVGVWRGEHGEPVANVGDAIYVGAERRAVGAMIAGQIFVACPPETHPAAKPAPVSVAQGICADIEELWDFRDPGGAIMAVGLVGAGLLAASLDWRPNGFITGPSNAGKSHLLNVLNAMAALSFFSTDTTKAGIESAISGRAVPVFLDEASDRADSTQTLIDVVLSASSGAGTKLHRGTADGVGRSIEVCTAITMASVSPPPMLPQHRSRFVLIELMKPQAGADHRAEMAALIERCAKAAPALLARALRSLALYRAALAQFRAALGRAGCVAREMDQAGSLLAGWWYLTSDHAPNDAEASNTVQAVANFIRGSDVMSEEDAPRQVLAIFLSSVVQVDRISNQATVARLLHDAFGNDPDEEGQRTAAVKALGTLGVRVVRAIDRNDRRGYPVPRLSDGDGVWLNMSAEPLKKLFANSPFAGDRWIQELKRLPTARTSRVSVRIADISCKGTWIDRSEFDEAGNAECVYVSGIEAQCDA
jgi:hypothetical protein